MIKIIVLCALFAFALSAPATSIEDAQSETSDLDTAEFFIKYWPWVYYKPVVAVQPVPYTYTYTIPKVVVTPVQVSKVVVAPVPKVVVAGAAVIPVSVNVEATVAKDTSSSS